MKKNAGTFRIEPDGFSIHTFELSKKVTNNDYKRMRDRLYCQRPKGEIGLGRERVSVIDAAGFSEMG